MAQYCVALYDWQRSRRGELSIRKNENLVVLDSSGSWWKVQNEQGVSGLVPSNYLMGESGLVPSKVKWLNPREQASPALDLLAEDFICSVETVRDYKNSHEDYELTVKRGEIVDIIDQPTDYPEWWGARKADGSIGMIPKKYLKVLHGRGPVYTGKTFICGVRALDDYETNDGEPDKLTFQKNDRMDILDKREIRWWLARKADGSAGWVPTDYVEVIPDAEPVFEAQDYRKILQDALKEGYVEVTIMKLLIVGPAGSGKTCLKYLLLGKLPPLTRTSTPCAEKPIRAVSWARFEMTEGGWREVSEEEFLAMVADAIHVICERLPSPPSEDMLAVVKELPSKESESSHGSGPPGASSGPPSGHVAQQDASSDRATQSILQQLLERIEKGSKSEKLMEADWIHFIDSGGQPAFQEVLPIFSRNTSVIASVHRLLERLEDYPTIEYYREGSRVGEPHLSPLTNEEIIQSMARSVQSQAGKLPNIIIIGTHRDLEHECSETRQEKNEKLLKLLCPHLRDQLIFRLSSDEIIFPVDTKTPVEVDRRVAAEMRLAVEAAAPDPVRIPVWWYILDSILQNLARMKGRRVLGRLECFKVAYLLRFNESSFVAALEYLDELNIIYYQPKILPNVVFSDSQVPLDKVTELVEESYRLRGQTGASAGKVTPKASKWKKFSLQGLTGASAGKVTPKVSKWKKFSLRGQTGASAGKVTPKTGKWKKFSHQAIVTLEFLKAFPRHYVPDLFTPPDLLKLLQGLLIAAHISGEEYFMPCLLDMLPQSELEQYRRASQELVPLLIHFPDCLPLKGVFCCLVVYLITHCKWRLVLPSGDLIQMSRNCIKFRLTRPPCSVTLIDAFTHFEVYLKAPPATYKRVCPTIHDSIFQGIKAALKNLHYESDVHAAFFCPHSCQPVALQSQASKESPPHLATLDDEGGYWMCSQDADMMGELTPEQRLWIDAPAVPPTPPPSLHQQTAPPPSRHRQATVPPPPHYRQTVLQSTPALSDLLEKVAARTPAKWRDMGVMLGLSPADLDRIEAENPLNCMRCYTAVFDHWMRGCVGEECSWAAVICALRSAAVNESGLAKNLECELDGR